MSDATDQLIAEWQDAKTRAERLERIRAEAHAAHVEADEEAQKANRLVAQIEEALGVFDIDVSRIGSGGIS